jgi:hypothetical protein
MTNSSKAPIYQPPTSFIDFSTPYNSSSSLLIIITIIAILFYIFILFKKKKNQYYSQEYWESRYSLFPKYMDWYCNFEKLNNDFNIEGLINSSYPNKKKTKIIELGCGNSTLAVDIKKIGYKNITSIDFSSIIIKQMQQKFINEDINCNILFK